MVDLVRFVDSITAVPAVRLSLTDGNVFSVSTETVIGDPPMRRAVTGTMMRDGDYVGVTTYGNRELNLAINLLPRSSDTAATAIQTLHRELDRSSNILEWRPDGASKSVFFRTFRSSPDSQRWDPYLKTMKVTVLAEPFAIGLREDITGLTVNNDPAAGANGLFLDLTSIKGDVETPLFIEYADGGGGLARSGFTVGVRTGSSPYPTLFRQAESFGMGTDTTAGADVTMSGGNRARCTFATATLQQRLSGIFPATANPAGAENWGVYRIFARVAQTIATDVITMTAGMVSGGTNRAVTIKSQTQPQMVDLGTLDTTRGRPTIGGYAATEYRIETQSTISIQASRTSGTGSLDIDYLVFVPADECLGSWGSWTNVGASTELGIVDGPGDAVYVATSLSGATPGRSLNSAKPAIFGRLPRVMPGDNRLVIVETSEAASPPTNALTTSLSMTLRYWPRYILVRPVST